MAGRSFQAWGAPIRSSSRSNASPPTSARLTMTCFSAGRFGRCGAIRSYRPRSQIRAFAPESARPYSSSGPVHQALSGHDDGAERGDREEAGRPFGQVDHGERDPVALADAALLQLGGDRGGGAEAGLEADPFLLEDRDGSLAVQAREAGQHGQRGRCILPHPRRDAADRQRLHFEAGARGGERRIDLRDGHVRPGGIQLETVDHAASYAASRANCQPRSN